MHFEVWFEAANLTRGSLSRHCFNENSKPVDVPPPRICQEGYPLKVLVRRQFDTSLQ